MFSSVSYLFSQIEVELMAAVMVSTNHQLNIVYRNLGDGSVELPMVGYLEQPS